MRLYLDRFGLMNIGPVAGLQTLAANNSSRRRCATRSPSAVGADETDKLRMAITKVQVMHDIGEKIVGCAKIQSFIKFDRDDVGNVSHN